MVIIRRISAAELYHSAHFTPDTHQTTASSRLSALERLLASVTP